MLYGLEKKVLEELNQIFSSIPEIEKVILYGSRAKGNHKNGSDIDITIVGLNLNLTIITKVELQIDTLYLPYSFDISIFQHITNKELISHIERVGKSIYEKNVNK